MHTNETTLLPALLKAHKEVSDYRRELASIHASELPENYDAVVLSEWLGHLASDVASDHACIKSGNTITRHGIDSLAGFLASFWETHHLLAEVLGEYELGLRKYFDHAEEMLAKAIADNSPTPPARPALTADQLDALAHNATNALFLHIQNELDPKNEHGLGDWCALNHENEFDEIKAIACKVALDISRHTRNA
jgi:hypothetical protein